MSLAFRKCKKDSNILKIILLQDFCLLKLKYLYISEFFFHIVIFSSKLSQ